jgi:hypothetical protein
MFEPEAQGPALNRFSRTPKVKIAATVSTAGVATVAANALDPYQNGDICRVVDAVDGTKYTGQMTAPVDALYYIAKISATTAQLVRQDTNANAAASVAVSAGAAIQFGDLVTQNGQLSRNIIPAGSVSGGAFGGPLD